MPENENGPGEEPEPSREHNRIKDSSAKENRKCAIAIAAKCVGKDLDAIADVIARELADLRRWNREYRLECEIAKEQLLSDEMIADNLIRETLKRRVIIEAGKLLHKRELKTLRDDREQLLAIVDDLERKLELATATRE